MRAVSRRTPLHFEPIWPSFSLYRVKADSGHPTALGANQDMKSLFTYELRRERKATCRKENSWAIGNPLDEAHDLHKMVSYGSSTVESIRELISVPAKIEAALLAYADRYRKDGQRIHCVLQFRRKVAEEFDRLVADRQDVRREKCGFSIMPAM